jgi:hypothetical protein
MEVRMTDGELLNWLQLDINDLTLTPEYNSKMALAVACRLLLLKGELLMVCKQQDKEAFDRGWKTLKDGE